ncbi:hypothetical protein [Reyranella sp.]|uniref:hypothetical protein n=1 Tax=Reyranella sp. TaxID=1929291 RepID=UPI003BABC921
MEKEVARRLMSTALSVGSELEKLDSVVGTLDAGREKNELVQALGGMMGILARDFVFPIARQHPDLDPDR